MNSHNFRRITRVVAIPLGLAVVLSATVAIGAKVSASDLAADLKLAVESVSKRTVSKDVESVAKTLATQRLQRQKFGVDPVLDKRLAAIKLKNPTFETDLADALGEHFEDVAFARGDDCVEPLAETGEQAWQGGGGCFHPCYTEGTVDACISETVASQSSDDCATINGIMNRCVDAGGESRDCEIATDLAVEQDSSVSGTVLGCDTESLENEAMWYCIEQSMTQCD